MKSIIVKYKYVIMLYELGVISLVIGILQTINNHYPENLLSFFFFLVFASGGIFHHRKIYKKYSGTLKPDNGQP